MPQVSTTQIAAALEDFIRVRFQVSPQDLNFSRGTDLWNEGYLDSLGIVEVVDFLQSRLNVTIPSEMLFDPDFVYINGMAQLMLRLVDGAAGLRDNIAHKQLDLGMNYQVPVGTTREA